MNPSSPIEAGLSVAMRFADIMGLSITLLARATLMQKKIYNTTDYRYTEHAYSIWKRTLFNDLSSGPVEVC